MAANPIINSVNNELAEAYQADIKMKMHELISMLKEDNADKQTIRFCKEKIDNLLHERTAADTNNLALQAALKRDNNAPNERINNLMQIVAASEADGFLQRIFGRKKVAKRVITSIIGIFLITIGFTMIVLPAPHDFEIYTIYYFNPNDGFTLMDLFSLMIVFGGVFLLIHNIRKNEL